MLYEIKFLDDLLENWAELKPRLSLGGLYAQDRGFGFEILSEYEIRTDYLHNAKFLWPYCRRTKNPVARERVRQLVERLGECTVDELCALFTEDVSQNSSQPIVALWQLIAERVLSTDIQAKLTSQTRIAYG